jgi:hypothetical protein
MSAARPSYRRQVAFAFAFALVIALIADGLARANSASTPGALLVSGAAFGGALGLAPTVLETRNRH